MTQIVGMFPSELIDGFALTKDSGIITIPFIDPGPDISLQTSWIIAQASIRPRLSTKRAAERTKVNGQVRERPRHDVTAAQSSRQLDIPTRDTLWGCDDRAIVGDVLPIAAQAVWITVEYGRVLGGFHVFRPVPVLSQFIHLVRTGTGTGRRGKKRGGGG